MEAARKAGGPLLPSGIPEHYRVHAEWRSRASQLWELGLSAGQDTAACHIHFLWKQIILVNHSFGVIGAVRVCLQELCLKGQRQVRKINPNNN